MTSAYPMVKRALDVAVSASVLIVSSPLFAVLSVLIHREDDGPVFYRGERAGQHGKPFSMFKFRSMVVNADRLGGTSSSANDPRITRIGSRMRQHKLDELPQFLNVLRGEMSLVGPRPQVMSAVASYVSEEMTLLSVKPGLTDWASIQFREEGTILARHDDPDLAYELYIRPEKSRLGLCYVATASLRTDLRILFETALVLLGRPARVPPCQSTPHLALTHGRNSENG